MDTCTAVSLDRLSDVESCLDLRTLREELTWPAVNERLTLVRTPDGASLYCRARPTMIDMPRRHDFIQWDYIGKTVLDTNIFVYPLVPGA